MNALLVSAPFTHTNAIQQVNDAAEYLIDFRTYVFHAYGGALRRFIIARHHYRLEIAVCLHQLPQPFAQSQQGDLPCIFRLQQFAVQVFNGGSFLIVAFRSDVAKSSP